MNIDLDRKLLELQQRHSILLTKRESLNSSFEAFYNSKTEDIDYFNADVVGATTRNTELLKSYEEFKQNSCQDYLNEKDEQLEKNYLAAIRSVFPVWIDELRQYQDRKIAKWGREVYMSDPEHVKINTLVSLEPENDLTQQTPRKKGILRK